jgi:SAM-dependent methyltransferase
MMAVDMYCPDWASMSIHECSPEWRGVSNKLRAAAAAYSFSYFDPNSPLGGPHFVNGAVNQNIEKMTFEDNTFDLFVAQDVFEHIFRPDLAIRQIDRVLKPGGCCIMTLPMVRGSKRSERRAELVEGEINHIKAAEYHGDPVNTEGTLVTLDWGFDACAYLSSCSSLSGAILVVHDLNKGIRAAYNEVIVLKKGIEHV